MEAGNRFESLRSAATKLARGEQMIVCVPSAEHAVMFRSSLSAGGAAAELLSSSLDAKNGALAAAAGKKAAARLPRRKFVVVELASADRAWQKSESGRLHFIENLSAAFRRGGVKGVWIIARPLLSEAAAAKLKDEARFFVDAFLIGRALYCQFLTAKGVFTPAFFLPRIARAGEPGIPLEQPALPAPSSAGVFVDLLQEPYRQAFEQALDGMVFFDNDAGNPVANARAREMLGIGTEAGPLTLARFVAPEGYRAALRFLSQLRRKKKAAGELLLRRKSGRPFSAAVSASVLKGRRSVVMFRDITEEARARGEAAAAAARQSVFAESSTVPQAVVAGARIVTCNSAFRLRFTWLDTGSGRVALREFFGKANAGLVKRLSAVPADGSTVESAISGDASITTPDGTRLDFAVASSRMAWEGKRAWHLSLTEMTGRIEAVRLLRESEQSLTAVLSHQAGAVSVVQDGRFAFVNGACAALLGFAAPADLTGKDAVLPVSPRGRKEFLERLSPGAPGKSKPFTMEYSVRKDDGTHRTIELRGDTILYAGRPAVVCFHTDISERRATEEGLRRREREHAIMGQLSHDIHSSLEPWEVQSALLRSAMRWLSFEQGGVYALDEGGKTLTLALQEGLSEKLTSTLGVQQAQEGATGLALKTAKALLLDAADYPAYLPYKTLFEAEGIRTVLYLPLVAGEEVNALMLFCSAKEASSPARDEVLLENISRHAGDALANALRFESVKTSELRYRSLIQSVADVVYEAGPAGAFRLVNAQVERLTGHAPEEFMRNPDLWRTLIHPDDRTAYARRISSREEGGDDLTLRYRLLPKGKAAYRQVRDAVRYRRDSSGAVTGMSGIVSDVTPQAEDGEATSAASQAHAGIMQSMQEGVVVYDRELRYREWNRPMELLTGFTRDQVLGRDGLDGPPDFKLADFADLLHRALAGMPVSSEDIGYLRPGTKDPLVLWGRFSPLRNSAGEIEGVVGTITDVTHRKSLERELRESEETLRNVIDTLGDALMISDLQGKVWEVNREFSHLTGYSRGDVLGMTFPYPWLIEEQMSRFLVWIAALREKKYLRDFDMTWKRQDGHKIAISINTTLLRNAAGEPVAMLNLARDISERHRLADELAGKGRQIEMLNRIISKANSTMEFPLIFDVIAEEVRALVSYDHMNVCLLTDDRTQMVFQASVGSEFPLPRPGDRVPVGKCGARRPMAEHRAVIVDDLTIIPEDERDTVAAGAGMHSEISIPIMLNERVLGTFNICDADVSAYSGKELSYLQPIADQIGALLDRTQLFQRVSDDRAYIHTLLNSIDSVVFTVDQASVVRQVNTAWREFALLQQTPDLRDEGAVVGRPLGDIIRNPDLRNELTAVVPRLFEATLNEFSREFEEGAAERVRSFQCAVAPMTINDRVTSLVFTLTDITESKRTEAEIKRRNQELLALNAVASSINKSLDTGTIFRVVRTELAKSISFESLHYFSIGRAGNLEAQFGPEGERTAHVDAADPALTGAADGTPFAGMSATGVALIAVPVRFKDRIAGVLALLRPKPDPDTHLRLVESIANLTGIAFDRALLFEDTVAKSDEIQNRNKELDDFTYVVSHDLKEPLITIEGYSKILLNEYREQVDDEGKGYLNSVVQSSQRMKNLIDDLLTLSRIGRVSEAQESLPLRSVIEAVMRDFEFTLKESGSEVNLPPSLPTVRYNRTQLGMVFRNLIANAIKFNRSDAPRIDIDVQTGEQEYTIGVRDNGIGIDQRHFDKIFVIFQRLHRTEDFRGTGAGLTIVKKIVENHRGRIWVESAVGKGTTFYFTIPK